MQFLSNILLTIGAFFGFGNPDVQVMKNSESMVEQSIIQSSAISSDGENINLNLNNKTYMWTNYKKPASSEIKQKLDDLAYKVTQEAGTERAGTSPLDKNYEAGIYVDILSGEPLFSSKDKFDSGTGWPSFTKPILDDAVTEHEDKKLFATRIEIRSTIADNHLGHVFTDGPKGSTGLRYCMNGVALKFIPQAEMEALGYGDFLPYI